MLEQAHSAACRMGSRASRRCTCPCRACMTIGVFIVSSLTLLCICDVLQVLREARLHATLDHPNVIKLYAAFRVRGRAAEGAQQAHAWRGSDAEAG